MFAAASDYLRGQGGAAAADYLEAVGIISRPRAFLVNCSVDYVFNHGGTRGILEEKISAERRKRHPIFRLFLAGRLRACLTKH